MRSIDVADAASRVVSASVSRGLDQSAASTARSGPALSTAPKSSGNGKPSSARVVLQDQTTESQKTKVVTPDLLRQLIDYDPLTGKMVWRRRDEESPWFSASWNGRYAGTPALACTSWNGYLTGRIFNRAFTAHRVAWAITYGKWPDGEIDHINGRRDDNRIVNLRDVPRILNSRNQKLHRTNTSGVAGVSLMKAKSLWRARIRINGKMKTIGTFASFDRAVLARKAAENELEYHLNHGAAR